MPGGSPAVGIREIGTDSKWGGHTGKLEEKFAEWVKAHDKAVFRTAVVCTVICSLLMVSGIVLNIKFPRYYELSVYLLTAASLAVMVTSIIWILHWAVDHKTLEEQLEILNSYVPPVEFYPAPKVPKMRFNFKENVVRNAFGSIAEKFGLRMSIEVTNFEILPFGHDCSPKKGYDICLRSDKHDKYFTIYIQQDIIQFRAPLICEEHFYLTDDIARTNRFGFAEDKCFISEINFDELSDEEIFGVIEKLVYALYGVTALKYEKRGSDLYRKYYTPMEYIFYLDAPDYYGYGEVTEVGNYKFILNGGTEND